MIDRTVVLDPIAVDIARCRELAITLQTEKEEENTVSSKLNEIRSRWAVWDATLEEVFPTSKIALNSAILSTLAILRDINRDTFGILSQTLGTICLNGLITRNGLSTEQILRAGMASANVQVSLMSNEARKVFDSLVKELPGMKLGRLPMKMYPDVDYLKNIFHPRNLSILNPEGETDKFSASAYTTGRSPFSIIPVMDPDPGTNSFFLGGGINTASIDISAGNVFNSAYWSAEDTLVIAVDNEEVKIPMVAEADGRMSIAFTKPLVSIYQVLAGARTVVNIEDTEWANGDSIEIIVNDISVDSRDLEDASAGYLTWDVSEGDDIELVFVGAGLTSINIKFFNQLLVKDLYGAKVKDLIGAIEPQRIESLPVIRQTMDTMCNVIKEYVDWLSTMGVNVTTVANIVKSNSSYWLTQRGDPDEIKELVKEYKHWYRILTLIAPLIMSSVDFIEYWSGILQ
jgi:hypothetical protein